MSARAQRDATHAAQLCVEAAMKVATLVRFAVATGVRGDTMWINAAVEVKSFE